MQEESASSLEKRNGGIGAFSPGGYSSFTTRERDGERETSAGKKRAKVAAYSLWLRLYLSSTLLADSQRLTVWRHRNSRMSPLLLVVHQLSAM